MYGRISAPGTRKNFKIREWYLTPPHLEFVQGVICTARWLYEPQPISNQWVRVGFPQREGGIDPGGRLFNCWVFYMYGIIFDQGMETYAPRVRRDLYVVPLRQLSQCAVSMYPSQSVRAGGFSTRLEALSTRAVTGFVSVLL